MVDGASNGTRDDCIIMSDVRIRCKYRESREVVLAKLGELLATAESALTLMAFKCLDDDIGIRVCGR